MTNSEIIQIVAILFSAIGVIIAICSNRRQLKTFNRQLKLTFFSEYTRRYQEIALNFPENINDSDFNYDKLEKEERNKILRYMRIYFDLCSEEYHLYKDGCLDENVWGNWEDGISHAMTKKSFKDAWIIVNRTSIFDGDFEEWIRLKMNNISV